MPFRSSTKATRKYPALPAVGNELVSHSAILRQIKENIEIHERRTSDYLSSFVRLEEIIDLGLVKIRGTQIVPGEVITTVETAVAALQADFSTLTVLETQVVDGALLARVADAETITGFWKFRGAAGVRVEDAAGTDHVTLSHDGSNMNYAHVNTSLAVLSGMTAVRVDGNLYVEASLAQTFTVDSSAVSGPYMTWFDNNVAFADIGTGANMGGGFTADALGILSRATFPLELGGGGVSTPQVKMDGTDVRSNSPFLALSTLAVTGVATFSSNLRGANEAAGDPTYSWTNDTDSGMYLASDGVVGIATAGVARIAASAALIQLANATEIDLTATTLDFNGKAIFDSGQSEVVRLISPDSVGDCYVGFFESDESTRKAYLGFGNTADDTFHIVNEETGANIIMSVTGTANIQITATNLDINANVDFNSPIALGGGAGATLGTIGGSGPTAAAQSQWLQISINGTTHWIPVWV